MQSFKFEIWPVKDFDGSVSGNVVTRPVQNGETKENEPIVNNFSKIRENMPLALQEVRVALDNMAKLYPAKKA